MRKKKLPVYKLFATYIDGNGTKRTFVANKLGISSTHLSNLLSDKAVLLDKHRKALNELLGTNY